MHLGEVLRERRGARDVEAARDLGVIDPLEVLRVQGAVDVGRDDVELARVVEADELVLADGSDVEHADVARLIVVRVRREDGEARPVGASIVAEPVRGLGAEHHPMDLRARAVRHQHRGPVAHALELAWRAIGR